MHCILLYRLQEFAELIPEGDAYLLNLIEFLFLVHHADVWQILIKLYIWLPSTPNLSCNIFRALSSFKSMLTLSISAIFNMLITPTQRLQHYLKNLFACDFQRDSNTSKFKI